MANIHSKSEEFDEFKNPNYGRNECALERIFLEIVTTYFLLEILTSVIRYSLILNYQQLVKDRNGVLIQHVYQSVDARKRNMMTGIIVLILQVNAVSMGEDPSSLDISQPKRSLI